jgi:hypothetical protein
MKHDKLVLTLLRRDVLASLRSMRRYDLAWVILGGTAVLIYAAADIFVGLQAHSSVLRNSAWLWFAVLPAAIVLSGLLAGLGLIQTALSRAHAPFLKALPLSTEERRRMVMFATVSIGGIFTVIAGVLAALVCIVVGKPHALAWALSFGVSFAIGLSAAILMRTRFSPTAADEMSAGSVDTLPRRNLLLKLDRFDRRTPAWLASWAWNLRGGIRLSWGLALASAAMGLVALIAGATSFAHHSAAPATVAGLVGGIALFMLVLRCHPLGSPVLRTAPIGFTRLWLRLLWLPLQLSVAFFLLPAGAALAAEPASWPMPIAGGLWLLILNGTYAVFAAYFMTSPWLAAFSFLSAIAYTSYESLEYGRTVLFGFAALVLFLWHRSLRRHYHG